MTDPDTELPSVPLLIGAAISIWVLARQRGFGLKKLEELVGPPLETAGMIILITSAGGAFGLALRNAGVGDAVKVVAQSYSINPFIFANAEAAPFIRIERDPCNRRLAIANVGATATAGLVIARERCE